MNNDECFHDLPLLLLLYHGIRECQMNFHVFEVDQGGETLLGLPTTKGGDPASKVLDGGVAEHL